MAEKFLFTAHGFGVGRDSNGLFTDVAEVLPDHTPKMMSFYKKHEDGSRDLEVMTHAEQAELLLNHMKKVEGERIILAHSMGNVALSMVALSGEVQVDKVIMMAPPLHDNEEDVMRRIGRLGGTPNPGGTSVIPLGDGRGNILLPYRYFDVRSVDLPDLYQKVAHAIPTVIVRALRDKFVDAESVARIYGVHHIAIDTDHNFKGHETRLSLKRELAAALSQDIAAQEGRE